MNRTLAVISAGLRQPSSTRLLADRLAAATQAELEQRGTTLDIEVVELRNHAHDLVNNLLVGYPSPKLKQVLDTVTGADGLIAVSPVFTASYSGLFKSFVDVLDDTALVDKPVLIAATGGTARHSLVLEHAMRPLFVYLRSVVVPTAVFAATDDWAGTSGEDSLSGRIDRATRQLATLLEQHDSVPSNDPFENPTPFDQLLAGE
jgi:FMN reductase